MTDDAFFAILMRFHRQVVMPDVERVIDTRISEVRGEIAALKSEMLSHFDAVYKRFDRLESEYQALADAVARLEARSVTRVEFEQAIEDLKHRVKHLEQRILELEKEN